jgi:hypothetical protein
VKAFNGSRTDNMSFGRWSGAIHLSAELSNQVCRNSNENFNTPDMINKEGFQRKKHLSRIALSSNFS